jgi:hypothetical protein
MLSFWSDWVDAAKFTVEVQGVIAMRMLKIAAGGPAADKECRLMVAEKIDAMSKAHGAAVSAVFSGKSMHDTYALAMAPYRRTMRANYARLSKS